MIGRILQRPNIIYEIQKLLQLQKTLCLEKRGRKFFLLTNLNFGN